MLHNALTDEVLVAIHNAALWRTLDLHYKRGAPNERTIQGVVQDSTTAVATVIERTLEAASEA